MNKLTKKEILDKTAQYPTSLATLVLSYGINPKYLSNLDKMEFWDLNALYIISEIYDVPWLKKVIINYLEMRVSVNAQGRKDVVEITKRSEQKLLQEFFEKIRTYKEKEFKE
jgi:hypothetical protein